MIVIGRAPVVEPTPCKKCGRDEPVSSLSPSKKRAAQEGDTGTPPLEDDLPRGSSPRTSSPNDMTLFVVITHGFIR